jgi:4-hydroxy-tetrahydrodipicolinate synthase
MRKDIVGCGTALVTPFRSDGAIDFKSLEHLVRIQCEAGVDFLVPCGATGEEPSLSLEEYLEVVRLTIEVSDGRLPVAAGICESSTHKAIAKASELVGLGADGLLVVSPPYLKPTQEGIYCHFKAITDAVPLPVIVYDVPGRTATRMLPETVLRLAEIPSIIGIKDASGSLIDAGTIALHAPRSFHIFSGHDALTLPLMALGASGIISVTANVAPKVVASAVRCSRENDVAGARALHQQLWPIITEIASVTSPLAIKCALALMDLIEEHFRLPLLPVSSARRDRMRSALIACGLLEHAALASH